MAIDRIANPSRYIGREPDAAVRLHEEAGMKVQEVSNILLSSACEDSCGLYEAIWELNSKFPDEPLGKKYEVAAAAVLELLEHGWIVLERVREGQEPEVISPEAVESILSNAVSWYPEHDDTTICFVATESGMRRYFGTDTSAISSEP